MIKMIQNSSLRFGLTITVLIFVTLGAKVGHCAPANLNGDDYKMGQDPPDQPSGVMTPPKNNEDDDADVSTYFVKGYTVKTKGVPDVSLHMSQIDGELVIKGLIGNGGTVRMNSTIDNVLWQIVQGANDDGSNEWIFVQPPPEIDVGLVQWERDEDRIFISGPLPPQDQDSPNGDVNGDEENSGEGVTATDTTTTDMTTTTDPVYVVLS